METITAKVKRTHYKTWRVSIKVGPLVLGSTPYEVTNNTKATAVAEFINAMHPETRQGWLKAWQSF